MLTGGSRRLTAIADLLPYFIRFQRVHTFEGRRIVMRYRPEIKTSVQRKSNLCTCRRDEAAKARKDVSCISRRASTKRRALCGHGSKDPQFRFLKSYLSVLRIWTHTTISDCFSCARAIDLVVDRNVFGTRTVRSVRGIHRASSNVEAFDDVLGMLPAVIQRVFDLINQGVLFVVSKHSKRSWFRQGPGVLTVKGDNHFGTIITRESSNVHSRLELANCLSHCAGGMQTLPASAPVNVDPIHLDVSQFTLPVPPLRRSRNHYPSP